VLGHYNPDEKTTIPPRKTPRFHADRNTDDTPDNNANEKRLMPSTPAQPTTTLVGAGMPAPPVL